MTGSDDSANAYPLPLTAEGVTADQLCVKGGFGAYREYLGGMGLYGAEVRFFNEIAPLYELARPASPQIPNPAIKT
jgi:hypothetical protein